MNYLITESQVSNLAMKYLNSTYGLEKYRTDNHPTLIFFVKGDLAYAEYDIERNILYFSSKLRNEIGRSLEKIFSMRVVKTEDVFDKWVGQYVDLDVTNLYFSEALPYDINSI
jgi:hypothetical protein